MDAIVEGSPPTTATIATTKNEGATTRSAVRNSGRGANTASSPIAHASHSSTSAVMRGASDQSRSATDAAGPAVSGSVTHTIRSAHIGTDHGE